MIGLTEQQQRLLALLRGNALAFLPPPTTREIMDHLGLRETSAVYQHLMALVKKGRLVKTSLGQRAYYKPTMAEILSAAWKRATPEERKEFVTKVANKVGTPEGQGLVQARKRGSK